MSGFINKIRAKIDAHHSTHPVAGQRDQFLAVTADTPVENKAHFTHEAVGAAAAYEAFKAFENHEALQGDTKPTHARAKEIIAGLAAGYAVKLVEEKGLPFGASVKMSQLTPAASEAEKEKFIADSQKTAVANSKRALRESTLYEQTELEPIDEDEKFGQNTI